MKVQYNIILVALLLGTTVAVRFSSEKSAMGAGSKQVFGDSAELVTPQGTGPEPVVCNVEFCEWCVEPDYCSQCQESLLNVNGKCVDPGCKDPNCNICDQGNKDTCYECRKQFYLDQGICVNPYCDDVNCLQCSENQKTCFKCSPGYELKDGKCECITQEEDENPICSPKCTKCKSYVICDECQPGYYTFWEGSHRICKPCSIQNCGICPDDTSYLPEDQGNCDCEKCAEGYHKIPFGFGENQKICKCLKCNVQHCSECNDQGDQCLVCQDHYGLVINPETNAEECIPCFNSPFWNGFITWQHPHCLSCDYEQCKSCDANENQELYDKTCRDKCDQDPCYRCDPNDSNVCIDCNRDDLWLTPQGTCEEKKICPPYQENPTKTDANGNSFVDHSSCVCIQDFYWEESIKSCKQNCHLTVENDFCDTCEDFDGYKCKVCHEGFQLQDGTCIQICLPSYCSVCTNFRVHECDSCFDGYYKHTNENTFTGSEPFNPSTYNGVECWKTCDDSVNYCTRCEDLDSSKCLICHDGFYDVDGDGQCDCDIKGCIDCYDDNQGKRCETCGECRTKSYDEKTCYATCDIPSPCAECKLFSKGDDCEETRKTCVTCIDNTYKLALQEDGRTICVPICNDSRCDDCLAEDRDHCNHCVGSWSVVDNKCTCEIPHCTTCSSEKTGGYCDDCWSQYSLTQDDTVCDCDFGGNHCLKCNDNDYSQCVTCDDDKYIIQDGQCVPHPCINNDQEQHPETYHCKVCVDYDLNDCEICDDGYVKNPKNLDRCDPPCYDDTCKVCSFGNPNGNDCEQCIDEYHYSQEYQQCWPDCVDQDGCQIPDADTCTCKLCKLGWFWDYKTQKCTQICQVNHCDICTQTSAYKCQQCNENYYHYQTDIDDINTVDSCECVDPQCFQCTTQGTFCEVCKKGTDGFEWVPINGECYPICLVPTCDHCKDKLEGTCEPVCQSDFVATSNQFSPFLWDCLPNCDLDVENDHCLICDFTIDPLVSLPNCCAQCVQGWHVENCKCVPDCNLNEFCDRCVEGNPNCCDTCLQGYNFEKSDDGCGCQCIQGFVYYDTLSPDQCLECLPEHCTKCETNNQNKCISCDTEYKVLSGQCERKNCTELEQNIYGCEYCSTNGCCDQCQDGYEATPTGEEGCFHCDLPCIKNKYPHCETCVRDGTFGSENKCTSCRSPNYYLDGDVCLCNVENCADCSSDSISGSAECKSCSPGYNLNNEKTECVKCPELRTWSVQQNKCVCITGYIEVGLGVIGDGEVEIPPGCYPKCSFLNKGCSVCQYFDVADTSKGKYCLACTNPETQELTEDKKKCVGKCDIPGCQECKRESDTCICDWEDLGWQKGQKIDNLGNLITEKCVPEPCGNNCFECKNNLEDGSYEADVCVDCDFGYDLIDGKCVKPCNQDPNECSECYLYNPDCCEQCTELYSDKQGCSCNRPCNLYSNHCNLCVEGNANSCEQCQTGYVQVDVGGGVYECHLDCSAYLTQVDLNCVQCEVRPGEEQADIVNIKNQLRCSQCKNQWWIPEDGVCKMKCDTNVVVHCQKCKDDQEQNCETCVDTHPWIVLNEPDGLYGCHPDCDDPHCEQCAFDDNTKCEKCVGDNIYKIDQFYDCVPNCKDPLCISCQVETLDRCDVCQNGWTPDANGVCKENCLFFDNNCTLCDVNQEVKNDRCEDCTHDLWTIQYLVEEDHWVCWPYCTVSNCYRCADQDSDQCVICQPSYHIHQGQCVPDCDAAVTHCLYCEESDRNRCVVCDSSNGASPNPDQNGVCPNICESFKGANCLLSNLYDELGFESTDNCYCDVCNTGYVHNPVDKLSCVCDSSNMIHCSLCSIPGHCEECDDPNWHVVEGQCELRPCPVNCLQCPEYDVECCTEPSERYALCGSCDSFQEIKSCTEHDENCVECTCSHCTKCDANHELDPLTSKCYYEFPCYKSQITGADTSVYKYFPNCEQCEATEEGDPTKGCCTDCIQRFYVNDCDCTSCPDTHCLECPNGQCKQCELYYGLDFNHNCQKCPDHCKYCDGDTSVCKECDEGYYNINGQCHECSEDCKICTQDTCQECKELGWYPIGDKCNPCSVDNCSICPNDLCEACIDGFFFKYYQNNWLETIRECDPCKVPHCFACSKGPNTCTQCEDGWELPCEGEDDKCIQSDIKSAQNVWNQSGLSNFIGENKKQLRDGQATNIDN